MNPTTAMNSPKEVNVELKAFFGGLGYRLKLLEETRAETDVLLSSRFNVFRFIEPDENRVCVVWCGSAPALRPYMPDELERMPFRIDW